MQSKARVSQKPRAPLKELTTLSVCPPLQKTSPWSSRLRLPAHLSPGVFETRKRNDYQATRRRIRTKVSRRLRRLTTAMAYLRKKAEEPQADPVLPVSPCPTLT